ncbi:hypothetical protein CGC52_06240 [Capnocytophaga sp. H2931]|nr:hypothetical protein CGC52_06240 [Capnocytophaga sp. H2931]
MRIILLFIISFSMYSQTLEGFVIDSLTQEPLPYANISFLDRNIGVSADENGFFKLDISKKESESVLISFVGYESKVVSLEKYVENRKYTQKINLLPTTEVLEEVVLVEKQLQKAKKTDVGTFHKKDVFLNSVPFGYEKAVFIENKTRKTGQITAVMLYFKSETNELYEQLEAFFRLNFYNVDDRGFPKETLSKELFLIKPGVKQQKIRVDLSNYGLPFPEKGIFVGVEVINPTEKQPKGSLYVTKPSLVHTHTDKNIVITRFRGKEWYKNSKKSTFKKEYYAVPRVKMEVLLPNRE